MAKKLSTTVLLGTAAVVAGAVAVKLSKPQGDSYPNTGAAQLTSEAVLAAAPSSPEPVQRSMPDLGTVMGGVMFKVVLLAIFFGLMVNFSHLEQTAFNISMIVSTLAFLVLLPVVCFALYFVVRGMQKSLDSAEVRGEVVGKVKFSLTAFMAKQFGFMIVSMLLAAQIAGVIGFSH